MKKSETHPIWQFLSSVKLTIVLLILLALVCILGTIIPQQQGAAEFARGLSPGMLRLFSSLDFFDMYHAAWFRFLIAFLALNLIVCSVHRFPATLKRFNAQPAPDRQKPFEGITDEETVITDRNFQETGLVLKKIIRSGFKRIREKSDASGQYFYMEKGRYSHFGVYLVHLSVLLIILGGLVGSFFGFEAHVNIIEGETVNRVILTKQMKPLPLGFEIRCEDFSVQFYDTGAPKEFKSTLTFLENGKKLQQNELLVNHPVKFGGITFYQATYGTVPGRELQLRIVNSSQPNAVTEMDVSAGKSYALPNGTATFEILDVRSDIMGLGPAVLLSVKPKDKKPLDFWVFKNLKAVRQKLPPAMLASPKFNPSVFKPYTFSLAGLQTRYYTGLQANRDPGVPIVWAGCFMMIAGLFVSFFLSHKRIWVRILKNNDETATIQVAGTTNKNPVGLQTELRQLFEKIYKEFGTKG